MLGDLETEYVVDWGVPVNKIHDGSDALIRGQC